VGREYILLIYLVSQATGVIMVPVVIAIAYAPEWLFKISFYFGIVILGASYILRITRGILVNLLEGRMPAIYLLLYLCTLEILPILFAYKLLVEGECFKEVTKTIG
jgi:4-hydroxybenzoate polyprenyltransferase